MRSPDQIGITWEENQLLMQKLRDKAALENRRQQNIYEVGDKVFYTGRANDNDLYTIKETYTGHDFVVGDNGADKNFWTLFLEEIRHATDSEIEAGKRLEVD
jgi:hypothetical protein